MDRGAVDEVGGDGVGEINGDSIGEDSSDDGKEICRAGVVVDELEECWYISGVRVEKVGGDFEFSGARKMVDNVVNMGAVSVRLGWYPALFDA